MNENIIFYDSDCLLCSNSIRFIHKIDHQDIFLFAPINGETYKKLVEKKYWSEDTIIYYRKNNTLIRSKAIIQMFLDLGGIWKVIFILKIIPPTVSDSFYRVIATYRKHFQTKTICHPPSENLKRKLLP